MHRPMIGSMWAQRRRRWPNIGPVHARSSDRTPSTRPWNNVWLHIYRNVPHVLLSVFGFDHMRCYMNSISPKIVQLLNESDTNIKFSVDNRFHPIINIGRGATEKNIPFVVYLHKSKMAAIGHIEFFNFWHTSPGIWCNTFFFTNLNTLILLEWFILRFKFIWRSKPRWLPMVTLKTIDFL